MLFTDCFLSRRNKNLKMESLKKEEDKGEMEEEKRKKEG